MAASTPLGEFEVTVLLAVMHLDTPASKSAGAAIRDDIESRTGRKVARGAVYVTLDRLENKGLLTSRFEDESPARGGHPRRFFTVTSAGLRHLRHSLAMIERMRAGLEPLLGER